jgi:membrane-bound lytic murein transglycosylase D
MSAILGGPGRQRQVALPAIGAAGKVPGLQPRSPPVSPRARLAAILAVLALAACAQAPQRAASAVDEARVDAILVDVKSAAELGETGLAALAAGDTDAAARALAGAREAFTAAAGRCATTPGCDLERVLSAQDALVARQTEVLVGGVADRTRMEDATPGEEANEESESPLLSEVPETQRAVALLKGQDLRTLIRVNEPVKAALEEWLTWMRPFLLEAHENYQFMRYRMWPEYERAGLPEALLFGILAKESGAKVHAVSRAGASGPLQFMYYTGRRYGLSVQDGFDQRFDPAAATRANVAYINDHLRIFNNDLELVLGAYNGGEGRMQRLSDRGAKRFWDPAVFNRLPPETRDYVPMVLAAAWLFLHPEEYNLRFPQVDARPGEITLTRATSLNELAVCLGQQGNERGWFRTLRNLNPRWESTDRIPAGTRLELPAVAAQAYSRTCVAGPLADLAAQLHAARKPGGAPASRVAGGGAPRTHLVQRGETLSSIARKFGCTNPRQIADANRIKAPRYAIRAGQRLVVPDCRA